MRDDSELEHRVAALECEVAELRQQLAAAAKPPTNWLEEMLNYPHDEEAMRLLAEIVEENAEAERRAVEAETP